MLLKNLPVRSLFLFIGILVSSKTGAGILNGAWLEPVYSYGKVLPEYSNFTYVVNDNVRSGEFNFTKQTYGKNTWEKLYNYPSYGLSFFYSTLGNKKVNGNELAIYPYAIFHLYSHNKFSLDNKVGIGLSYVTRKYELGTNYENVVVGSNLNAHFHFKIGTNYLLSKKINLSAGLSFGHFSNGNLREPNVGINYISIYGGIGYLVGTAKEKQDVTLDPFEKSHVYEIVCAFGGKHAKALQSKFYSTFSLGLEYKWKCFRIVNFGLGADFFYDSATQTEMLARNNYSYKNTYDYKTGIHLSQELVYNKTSLILQEGLYIGFVDKASHYKMYNRGMVKHYFNDNIFATLSMKSHLHILDHPELGIGFTWK